MGQSLIYGRIMFDSGKRHPVLHQIPMRKLVCRSIPPVGPCPADAYEGRVSDRDSPAHRRGLQEDSALPSPAGGWKPPGLTHCRHRSGIT